MKNLIEFVEIPSVNFGRAVKFYENVFGIKLSICGDCDSEKMAFFGDCSVKPNMAISWSADFHPSKDGVLIHLPVESIETALERINANGGKTIRKKTKIDVDGLGYFAMFSDSEGNTLGLYSKK